MTYGLLRNQKPKNMIIIVTSPNPDYHVQVINSLITKNNEENENIHFVVIIKGTKYGRDIEWKQSEETKNDVISAFSCLDNFDLLILTNVFDIVDIIEDYK